MFVNQYSEIGKLNIVMVHRPDIEVAQIMPDFLEEMLAEDTPYVPAAQREHDVFAKTLRDNGAEVLYLRELFAEAVADEKTRRQFVNDYVEMSHVQGEGVREAIREYLYPKSPEELFHEAAKGIMRGDLAQYGDRLIQIAVKDAYPFLIDPIPNAYFTRDIGISIGNGMIISSMSKHSRKRETLLLKYIQRYHPRFTEFPVPLWYDTAEGYEIEGGDVLVLSNKVLAIGCGERTSVSAVECVAKNLFKNGYEHILLFNNPKSRKFMHLDVLCTMVDYDKFLVNPCIADKWFEIYDITPGANGGLNVSCTTEPVSEIFKKALSLPAVEFIEVGGGDPIVAAREHWNMGSNSLTLAPGNIITYDRNDVTNELLVKAGVKVNTIPGGELSRGRGGPRCMSMPINRTDVW